MAPPRVVGLSARDSGAPAEPPAAGPRAPDVPFVELAARSAFSLLEGASTPEALAGRAAEVGMPALALADRFDLGGAVRFHRACERKGVRPILGAEVAFGEGRPPGAGSSPGTSSSGGAASSRGPEAAGAAPGGMPPLVLLCGDRQGYANLSALVTEARLSNPRGEPVLSPADLEGRTEGLTALARATEAAPARGGPPGGGLERLRRLFPGRLYLALEHHGLPEEARRCEAWMEGAERAGVPWIPANAPRYARPGDRIVQDALACLRHDTTLDEAGDRLLPNGEWYLKSAEQMARRWPARALRRTVEVAARCGFRVTEMEPSFPAFEAPGGRGPQEFLRALVEEGARERYGEDLGPEHREQIEHELGVIGRLGLADYFLVMWDVVRFARRREIPVQGRGSAANSAVCYCLGITAVDPVGRDLLFERFLSEERGEAPDIDLDVAHRDREEVLQYVYRKYGRAHAAMVCETVTYRGRMAARDAARVLGYPTEAADRLAAEADMGEAAEAARRLADGGLERAGLDPADPRARALVRLVRGMDRLPRHRSIHVGGFVITARPVGEVVPVEEASMEGRTVIQWDKDDLAELGIVKLDLLGLGMLTVLGKAIGHVRRVRGEELDLASLPPEDEATYDMLCEADTVGVFQVESRAQMNTLPRVRPRSFYELAIEVALIRPGPIQGEMVHPYLRRRRGEEPVTYLDERLEPVLERTLGVPLFQEQGMKVAVLLAGFTPAQADRLRRAMGFKRSRREMERVGEELAEGLEENGVPPEVREKIFRQLTAFANYGFPESHALSFALLVYASAYLKRHYAPEFCCALLNAQPMGFYAPSTLVEDARRRGVEVRPVDLRRSEWNCTLEPTPGEPGSGGDAASPDGPALRIGLRMVRGLGARAKEKLRAAREEGPFASVEDVVRRSGLGAAELRTLAEAGAFGSLWPGRREALWELLRELRGNAGPLAPRPRAGERETESEPTGASPTRDSNRAGRPAPSGAAPARREGRRSAEGTAPAARPRPSGLPSMSRAERVRADYRAVGLSTEGHPVEFLRDRLRAEGVIAAAELRGCPVGAEVEVAGIAICRQRPSTAKGVMFVTLEDETGFANFVVGVEMQERLRHVLLGSPALRMRGVVEREGKVVNVQARNASTLSVEAPEAMPQRDFR